MIFGSKKRKMRYVKLMELIKKTTAKVNKKKTKKHINKQTVEMDIKMFPLVNLHAIIRIKRYLYG